MFDCRCNIFDSNDVKHTCFKIFQLCPVKQNCIHDFILPFQNGYTHGFTWTWCPWWRHQMEIFSVLLAFCAGNSQITGALIFSLICAWINSWVNNHDVGGLRCHRNHYDVTVMKITLSSHNDIPSSQRVMYRLFHSARKISNDKLLIAKAVL